MDEQADNSTPPVKQETPETTKKELTFQIPEEVNINAAPLRSWLNEEITPVLIQGLRIISKER